ncbi:MULTISPECIES: NfeD family protein [unclassified Roseofilum]|uniref:NfeD family protein n=1 Tax=unclassified Roseofilum TaxID=2620099 RepID=UPI001B157123|nr:MULTISPECIES: NfeD family protein [unclassified Roseofilum]MBP0008886.1 NfeD family protein [Roseofilum sp. Belize Diploria]MBP0033280.1 NfeD family protein [Roseofilum sp. Belize BBD 4]
MNWHKTPPPRANLWQWLRGVSRPSSPKVTIPTPLLPCWTTSDPLVPLEGEGVVDKPIPPYGRGRVYYRGSWWPATCTEETTLLTGQEVKVIQRQNLTLWVTPVASRLTQR